MRTLAPLLAALVAAGCFVSTSEFRPTTDAACAAREPGTKACGNRCVDANHPANGCAAPGDCQPCPEPTEANRVATCSAAGRCSVACVAGWADCDGAAANGCETLIEGNDAAHCGNCTHACDFGVCVRGVCSGAEVASWPPSQLPGAMARDTDGTIRYVLVDAAALTTTEGITSQVCALGGACTTVAGAASVLASAAGTWWAGVRDGSSLVVVEGPPAGPTVVTTVATTKWAGEAIDAILVTTRARVLYTTPTMHQDPTGPESYLHVLEPGGTPVGISVAVQTSMPRGIGAIPPFYFVGSGDEGGTLFRYEDAARVDHPTTTVARTGTANPTRIVGWSDPLGNAYLVWASQDDGSVWRAAVNTTYGTIDVPHRLADATGSTAHMELASDADGVYWCNHGTGRVSRWRPSDDAVFDVGSSASPQSLATDATRVYWTDPVARRLYRAAK
jgi:hypothetical protein